MINQLCRSFESSSPLILSKIKVIQELHFDSLLQCLDSLNSPFLNRYTQPNPQRTPLDKNPQEPPVVEDKTRRFYSPTNPTNLHPLGIFNSVPWTLSNSSLTHNARMIMCNCVGDDEERR